MYTIDFQLPKMLKVAQSFCIELSSISLRSLSILFYSILSLSIEYIIHTVFHDIKLYKLLLVIFLVMYA